MSHATVAISGTVGKDAELKQLQNGGWMARFNVASNSQVKNQSGNYEDVATWFRVTYFARSDRWMAQFIKGARVFVTGELCQRTYTNRDGNQASNLEVTATHAESLSPRQDAPQQARPQPQQPRQQAEAGNPYDDDIPFAPVKNTW